MKERAGIQSVEVGFGLLQVLGEAAGPLMLRDLARAANMSAAKAHRYLVSFQRLELVVQDSASTRYDLGPAALKLGLASLSRLDAVRLARQRVALLKGVSVEHMEQVFAERLRFNPGARELIATAKAAGLTTLLVSGGFTFFADRVKAALGIDFARSNVLEVQDGLLTGRMVDQAWGDICDGAEKRRTLLEVASLMGIDPRQAIAVGDGANDLPMMGAAGLSVAYRAKPAVRAQANVAINDGGLDRLLEVLR